MSGSYAIKNNTLTIANGAFAYSKQLTSVTIPDSVTTIGEHAFAYSESLTNITVDANNNNYSSDEYGVLFNKDKTKLIQYPVANTRTDYIIPGSVTIIGEYAFYECNNLTSITIPSNVTTIGEYAFQDCTNLLNVTIPNSVTIIGKYAFEGCCSLISLTIGNSVTTIDEWAFNNCYNLTSVSIPNSVTTIGKYAFGGCCSLISLTIGNSVTTIGEWAFNDCDTLKIVTIPDSVATIESSAFISCDNLTSVIIGNGLTSIVDTPFVACPNLTSIIVSSSNKNYSSDDYGVLFDKNKTEIIRYPVANPRTSYTIPGSVTTISDSAFSWGDNLTSVTIPNSVTTISYSAFNSCENIKDVYYTGTEEQWNNISIGQNNDDLTNATIHFQYSDIPVTPPVTTKTLSSISIDTLPAKVQYTVGEELDTTGMVVSAKYSDGTSAVVTNYEVYGFDSSKAGTSVVRVSYSENGTTKTTAFSVTINEADTQDPGDNNGSGFSFDTVIEFFNGVLEFFANILEFIINLFYSLA